MCTMILTRFPFSYGYTLPPASLDLLIYHQNIVGSYMRLLWTQQRCAYSNAITQYIFTTVLRRCPTRQQKCMAHLDETKNLQV